MAKASGLSVSSVQRIWRAFGLQPHRMETFKLSTDPNFVAKVRDVVGLYVSPPEHAIVLCVDEKSQIQARDRSQPMLPMRPGQPARRSHDYTRNGTTSLFAALDIATGRIIGKCYGRHRAAGFASSLTRSRPPCRVTSMFTLSWTITPRTKPAHPQMAGQKAALARAPDPDKLVVAQSGRALLCAPNRQKNQMRHLPKRRRPQGRYRFLHRMPQRRSQTVPMDQVGRRYFRVRRTLLPLQCSCND